MRHFNSIEEAQNHIYDYRILENTNDCIDIEEKLNFKYEFGDYVIIQMIKYGKISKPIIAIFHKFDAIDAGFIEICLIEKPKNYYYNFTYDYVFNDVNYIAYYIEDINYTRIFYYNHGHETHICKYDIQTYKELYRIHLNRQK